MAYVKVAELIVLLSESERQTEQLRQTLAS